MFTRPFLTLVSDEYPSDSDDIKNVDLTRVHNLSGPIAVEDAEPGDALVVDILDGMSEAVRKYLRTNPTVLVTPFPQMPWGYTVSDGLC